MYQTVISYNGCHIIKNAWAINTRTDIATVACFLARVIQSFAQKSIQNEMCNNSARRTGT